MKNSNRVPFWEKLVLGIGGFPSLFGYIGINTVARTVYIMILGVNPLLVGLALFATRFSSLASIASRARF